MSKSHSINTHKRVWNHEEVDLLLPKSKPIVVVDCYRPPPPPTNDFIEKLEEVMFKIRTDSKIHLLGDFNICFSEVLKLMQKIS